MSAREIPTVKLLIDGEFVESRSSEWREVVNPHRDVATLRD